MYLFILSKDTNEDVQNNWKILLNLKGFSVYTVFPIGIFVVKRKRKAQQIIVFLYIFH